MRPMETGLPNLSRSSKARTLQLSKGLKLTEYITQNKLLKKMPKPHDLCIVCINIKER